MKRLVWVLAVLFLSGCLSPKITLNFSPNPIVLKPGDEMFEGEISVYASGWDILNVEEVVVSFLDADGKPIIEPFGIELYTSVPAIGEGITQKIPLLITYDAVLITGLKTVRFEITGSHYVRYDVEVVLADSGSN